MAKRRQTLATRLMEAVGPAIQKHIPDAWIENAAEAMKPAESIIDSLNEIDKILTGPEEPPRTILDKKPAKPTGAAARNAGRPITRAPRTDTDDEAGGTKLEKTFD